MFMEFVNNIFGNINHISFAALEIFFLYIIIYYAILYMKGTRAVYILLGILGTFIMLYIVSFSLKLNVIEWFLRQFWGIIAFAGVVIFQPEIRRGFAYLGSRRFLPHHQTQKKVLDELCLALTYLSEHRTGALIVLERNEQIKNEAASGGVELEAKVSAPLLEAIFSIKSPIHDGAVVINGGTIIAAHMILPLGDPAKGYLGTRHRAALGISEETDAIALVVSEETGKISIAYHGELETNIPIYKLNEHLMSTINRVNITEEKEESEAENA